MFNVTVTPDDRAMKVSYGVLWFMQRQGAYPLRGLCIPPFSFSRVIVLSRR
jgi:hypothetical protein